MVTWTNGKIAPARPCACGCKRMLPVEHVGRMGRPRRYLNPQHRYRAQAAERKDPGQGGVQTYAARHDISAARIEAVIAQAQTWLTYQRRHGRA